MKKRSLRERKEVFKKAYYAELKKQNIVDSKELTRAELMKQAKERGLKIKATMIKADLVELLNNAENTAENTENNAEGGE